MADFDWTGGDLPTFVTHLECALTGERYPADILHGLSHAGRPLLVRYDLDGVRRALTARGARRPPANPVALPRAVAGAPSRKRRLARRGRDPADPAALAGRLAKDGELLVKDEGRLPTGSFKARGLALAVSMAKELGVTAMAMPTNGNAGAAMAAYCARAGIKPRRVLSPTTRPM